MHLRNAALAFLFVAGCTGSAPSAGNAALGVTKFEINETSTTLSIVGYDSKHVGVAQLTLRRGWMEIPEEQLAGDGRELNVVVNGDGVDHKSVGTQPVRLPLIPTMTKFNAFVTDPQVAAALTKWGIGFDMQQPSGQPRAERTYGSPSCGHSTNAACGATDCFSNGDDSYEEVCCGSNGDGAGDPAFVVRSCSTPYGTSACGTNGPGGCAACYNIRYYSVCTLWTWPDCTIDYNGPSCEPGENWECQGVYGCSTCDGPYDGNGFGGCNPQSC